MTLRDAEMDLVHFLEAAGLELSTTTSPPTLYAGGYPDDGPPQLVCVRHTGGDNQVYLGGERGLVSADLQVVVRGRRENVGAARDLAVACWSVLHVARIPGFVAIRVEGAGPIKQPIDGNGRPRFSFNLVASYHG